MKKEYVFSTCLLFLLWQVLGMIIHNNVILPMPKEFFTRFIEIITTGASYTHILITCIRVFEGFAVSLIVAIIMCLASCLSQRIERLLSPLLLLARTIPNASYIILALIWLGSEGAVTVVIFMILFPIFYNGFMNKIHTQNSGMKDAEAIYHGNIFERAFVWILPEILDEILYTGKTAMSMGFKVGVMAEILGQVRTGIGRRIQFARLNLDTGMLFAWTAIIILIAIMSDKLFDRLIRHKCTKERLWKD